VPGVVLAAAVRVAMPVAAVVAVPPPTAAEAPATGTGVKVTVVPAATGVPEASVTRTESGFPKVVVVRAAWLSPA
jgi:hypothetical protein